jgi:hypothetical protein
MSRMVPETLPRMGADELLPRVKSAGLDTSQHPVFVVGIRGYYRQTMGDPQGNDRGIYDDAMFLISPNFFGSYNANTDPSYRRPGSGFEEGKRGMAMLKPGVWYCHRFGLHRNKYMALCQTAGPVTVIRDGVEHDYPHTGPFGINIHRGGRNRTSSLGCQTVYEPQWEGFIGSAIDQARRFHGSAWQRTTIPYVLMEA